MLRRTTLSERLHPSVEATTIAAAWSDELILRLLSLIWEGYIALAEIVEEIDLSQGLDDLERDLTEHLFRQIQMRWDTSLSVQPGHAIAEREFRAPPPAQPPLYDIAFTLNANPRIIWPLEAKVLLSDRDTQTNLGDYVNTFRERFMTCRYAPFSPSGAMLGYLLSGNPETMLDRIAVRLGCTMTQHPQFAAYVHRTSDHFRAVEAGKPYPARFRCHHLMMPLYSNQTLALEMAEMLEL